MVSPGDAIEIARAGVLSGDAIAPEAESLPAGATYRMAARDSEPAAAIAAKRIMGISPTLSLVRFNPHPCSVAKSNGKIGG